MKGLQIYYRYIILIEKEKNKEKEEEEGRASSTKKWEQKIRWTKFTKGSMEHGGKVKYK